MLAAMNNGSTPPINYLPELEDEQFLLWQKLLEERIGICVADHRRQYIKTCLGLRMRELGLTDYSDYYQQVVDGAAGAIEWNLLLDRVTVRETRFFRDPEAMNLVSSYLRILANSSIEAIDVWSVGCASGEEAYSLAMIADTITRQLPVTYSVFGTDISGKALKSALLGLYSNHTTRLVPVQYRNAYMSQCESGDYMVNQQIKDRCCFINLNLKTLEKNKYPRHHLIYCQNVLIYFRKWRKKDILNALVDHLLPGGLLITGMGEATDWKHSSMTALKVTGVNAFLKNGTNIGPEIIMGMTRR